MSLYFGSFGVSPATQTLQASMPAASARMLEAQRAAGVAADTVDALTNQMSSAQALNSQLSRLDADWFKRVAASSSNSGADWALYQKYIAGFPIDPRVQSGPMWDFDAPNEILFNDQQAAWHAAQDAENALPAARAQKTATASELSAAQSAVVTLNKQYEASVASDARAAAATAAAAQAAQVTAASPPSSSKGMLIGIAVAVPVLLIAVAALTKKKSTAVAGYRRRRSRR